MIHPAKVVIRIDTNIERQDTVSVSVYSDFEDNGSLLIRFYRSRPEYAAYAGISYLLASGRGNEVAGFELSVERTAEHDAFVGQNFPFTEGIESFEDLDGRATQVVFVGEARRMVKYKKNVLNCCGQMVRELSAQLDKDLRDASA